ncbi:hypothetical protein DDD64_01940 [Actinotignum sanguinis]|uniref:hypothetical protein n=2 Tax=Actinotignum TaxID=1653174 RepID=UPI000F7F59BA|nr:hypothetical protein [Actinotignum sanguinis]MDY5148471.1 hypothetical protein [Actinotignum sanguinis]RTE51190.1 hypothetical protein DDD64_01940 [Actinotignum sanguinis]
MSGEGKTKRVALLVRLCVFGMVAGILAGMILGALVPGIKEARTGPQQAANAELEGGREPEALAVAHQLVAARDAALTAGDTASLSSLSVPEGAAAAADAQLRSALEASPVAKVETEVRKASWVGEDLLEVITVQRSLVLANGETIGPQPERCARWQLSPQPWRIVAVHPCL